MELEHVRLGTNCRRSRKSKKIFASDGSGAKIVEILMKSARKFDICFSGFAFQIILPRSCGAAAGVSAAFGAPLGGILFAVPRGHGLLSDLTRCIIFRLFFNESSDCPHLFDENLCFFISFSMKVHNFLIPRSGERPSRRHPLRGHPWTRTSRISRARTCQST